MSTEDGYSSFLAGSGSKDVTRPVHFRPTQNQKDILKSSLKSRGGMPVSKADGNGAEALKSLKSCMGLVDTIEKPTMAISHKDFLSTDIIRSASFDSSSKVYNTSRMLRRFKQHSVYESIDHNAYCSPCDRIGRLNTITAASLGMTTATVIAKNRIASGKVTDRKVVGFSLAVTAPDAFDATNRINEIALSETGKLPVQPVLVEESKRVPEDILESTAEEWEERFSEQYKKPYWKHKTSGVNTWACPIEQALREPHRRCRSDAAYGTLAPSPTKSMELKESFDAWSPESAQKVGSRVVDNTSDLKKELLDTARSVDLFNMAVKAQISDGVPTASGSGQTMPVPSQKNKNVESILMRIPSSYTLHQSADYDRCLNGELDEVGELYLQGSAQASILYTLQDPHEAKLMKIDMERLTTGASGMVMWTDTTYQSAEWKILRDTGVRAPAVLSSFRRISRTLYSRTPIMLALQMLWENDSMPPFWWDANPKIQFCNYSQILFTEANQNSFLKKLPLSLEEFTTSVATFGKDIRESLIEHWLVTVGTSLNTYISQLTDGGMTSRDAPKSDPENDDNGATDGPGHLTSPLANRLGIEGLRSTERAIGKPQKSASENKKDRTKTERILDTAAVLMSQQLRTMCENSLRSVSSLFSRMDNPLCSDYTVFQISLKVRKPGKKEPTTDFTDVVEVFLYPDISDFKAALSGSLRQIVGFSREFTRAETAIGAGFGGENAVYVDTQKTKKLNDASVGFTDSVLIDTTMEIHDNITKCFDAPSELIKKFDMFDSLLNGSLAKRVTKVIADCSNSEDTAVSLETLSGICIELDTLMDLAKKIVPDICYFPVYEVRCVDIKELLARQLKLLHTQVMEAVLAENNTQMLQICNKYQEIANTLIAEVTDAQELKTLQEFTNKSALTLGELYEQYTTQCYERVRFLLGNKHRLSRDDTQILYTTYNWPLNIQSYLKRSFDSQGQRKRELEELLEEDQRKLESDLLDISKKLELVADNSSPMDFRKNVDRLAAFRRDLEQRQQMAEDLAERETLLEVPKTDLLSKADELVVALDPIERLWNTVKQFVESNHYWHEAPLTEINPEESERTADELWRTLMKLGKEFDKMGETRKTAKIIAQKLQDEVKEFINDSVPLMLLVCNPGMRERHWTEIEGITGLHIPKGDVLCMNTILEVGLQHTVKEIEDTCVAASKEFSLQIALTKMEGEWETMIFNTKEYRTTGTRILAGIDEIQQLLDDQIVKTQAMKGSRYIKPFLEQITVWEVTLVSMQDILDNWLKVQATWLYLEPIFSSDDIMRQMPTEGKMFRTVDNTWRESMAQTYEEPGCVKVARRPGMLESLIEANKKLEIIQKGLNDYLETKRLAFPRFFFLSSDELLEILAETKDPLRVQPHLKKCFDGIASLNFQPNLDITGCADPKGEKLDFPYDKVKHKKINPNDSGGNVEKWLIEVEVMMKKSLAYAIDFSMADCLKSDRIEWLQRWQGQVIICINQTRWCVDVEKVLDDGAIGIGLPGYYQLLCDQLMKTVELVRGDISKALRVAIGALVVMDVHNRDTINELIDQKVEHKTDFDWLAQLRYYWDASGESALSGVPKSVQCKMINAMALYAYEYIGNQDRLVITPLTDRCYRTLMGAIHLNLGGAPEGPAGTGKTETTKDLAKAIAIQCVVTNCSDGLDYLAMAKFFKGLASSGSWACFDEFNRIQLEVLSVIAQQILQIQMAKMKGLDRFVFEGTELGIKPTCCPFITMNPGYAGRAELPDNLKVLFRTVAMMVPDYAMISEIILYSFGYTTAKPLSVKIVTTYKLCSEQLSSQSHYDYGMRAVIAVLRAAGNLKRSDGHLPEDVLVLRAIVDVNLAKFLSPDVPLFRGICSDLFPGVVPDEPDRDAMKEAFRESCKARSLQPEDYFWNKIVQIYDMMVVRHGFMIVGQPFSGKTMGWRVLGDILGILSERFPDDKRWSKVIPIVMNPKSITMGQLYGQFDPVSHEWTDGVIAINYRMAASNKIGNPEDRKWILFDGPVDAIWIENMNTVLDDNKKLCLMSGEIIAMTDVMSMMFEPMDLLVASPATVSRCGMIYLEPEQLGWRPLYASWCDKFKVDGDFRDKVDPESEDAVLELSNEDIQYLTSLVDWLVEPCLCFLRKECTEMSPTVDSNLIMSFLNIFEAMLIRAYGKYKLQKNENNEVIPLDAKQLKMRTQDMECCFMFALMWSIGITGTAASQAKFSVFIENVISNIGCIEEEYRGVWNALQMRQWVKPDFSTGAFKGHFSYGMPIKYNYYECIYLPEDSKWKYWVDLLPSYTIPADTKYSQIVVPNSYTAQYSYMLRLLVPRRKHVLMCGPTGTGKSVYVYKTITSELPHDKFKPLCLGFSAKTSANMTQDIVDGKLDKRRKGVYGPPMGQQTILFIDDLNMPEVETYGAQPPIELIRQLIGNGGWYDLKEKSWRSIIDTSVVSAMGPPGGGRNFVTPRLLRHFNLFCFAEFDETTLKRIFSTIVQWHLTTYSFPSDVRSMGDILVDATLDTYKAAMMNLLPTPQKSHYTFNLRDFSRVIQGLLMVKPSENFDKPALVRLWSHESLRVFGDRLVTDGDREWFHNHLSLVCSSKFSVNFADVFKHLDTSGEKKPSVSDFRNLIFGDYTSSDDPRPYVEIKNMSELSEKIEEYLSEFNAQSKKPMDLVMFGFAIEHVSKISRILRMPGGNALLVGVGGSGRQSVTRLAAFINSCDVIQIEISKNYTNVEWREDLKRVIRGAGATTTPQLFLFSDTQIKNETFVEDINNMLNSGEVPNIFPSDEKSAICEQVRPFAKQVYGKAAADMNAQDLYAFFISRVKENLHIVLAFSPIGDAFRDRLRKFPALINCCTIDWFTSWPSDALVAVAERFLADVSFSSDEARASIVKLCQKFHQDVISLSDQFRAQLNRINYITPTSYLELILAFKSKLDLKRGEVSAAKKRYVTGLEKLAFAATQVDVMKKELADLQPELIQSAADTEVLMGQIEEKLPGVMETRKTVSAEAAVAQGEADVVQKQKSEVEADLAEAIPALESALAALDTIKPTDINEIKALSKPPDKIKLTCKAVCIFLSIKPERIPDPDDPSKRIMDYWGPSQKMLADATLIQKLKAYDKDNMAKKIVDEIKNDFVPNPDFSPEVVAKASKAAEGLCRWCHAMVLYDRVAKVVAPKKAALAEAESVLAVTMAALNKKKDALQAVEDDLAALEKNLQDAKDKKLALETQATSCDTKIGRANELLDGLGGERQRWTQFAEELGEQYTQLTGDVLISAGLMAYLGPFTAMYRQRQTMDWAQQIKNEQIPCSDAPSLTRTLGEPVRIRQWNIDGLPTDGFSVENGIIVFNSRRWPLMIDPQGQANKWTRNMEKKNNLQIIKLTDGNYLRALENSIQFGYPVLLENVAEELDPSLEPLLAKQIFKQGGVNCIRLGDATVEYSDNFRFYITTKLRNPHYLPEVSVKVTLLNFMITPEGLEDQLLGIVVSQERPDLEEQRNKLIVESAENKRMLKEIEDKILHIMSSSSGNILEDETAIETLKGSKTLSDEISQKQAIAEQTEININNVRKSYSPIAFSSQILFFCIADLANIEPVYQYSLTWFINLFIASIQNSEKGKDVEKRLFNLDTHFTYSLYKNVCRSLLEKDKLLFSFLLTVRIMGGKGKIDDQEWFFLLTGGMGKENLVPNPAPEWLNAKNWDAICRLGEMEKYATYQQDFVENIAAWKNVYDSLTPQEETFPGIFSGVAGLGRLCAIRTIRSDKVVMAIQRFVLEEMGDKFVKPPPFDLQACYNDSSSVVPLVFILSPGSDPMGAVIRAGEQLGVHVDPISLGQGQGPKADALIEAAKRKGSWVVLQNCHLAPSYMTTLEKTCEELDPDETHASFRLWCTTYPSEIFPVAVLQNGVKMTNEPPKGLRANLLGSFNIDPIANEEYFNDCTKPVEFKRLIFGLCFFHALVQERRLYGPLGWNIPYEFNESDLRISLQQLRLFLDENDFVPYKAIRYTAGECNYGGRVTDDKDRRTLMCILARFYSPEFLGPDFLISPSGIFPVPPDTLEDRDQFIQFIDELPLLAAPEVFGMHDNATLTRDQNDTNKILQSILDAEGGGSGGGGGGSGKDEAILEVSGDIAAKLPENFDMEYAQLKYPVKWDESMNTVVCQELIRFNNLLSVMRSSLSNVQKAVKGLVVMSSELEILGNSLFINRTPVLWKAKSYPSLKPLSGYISDQQERLGFFRDWLVNKPPPVFWISGFFFTQAFLTGAAQNYARRYTIPIDDVVFDFEMKSEDTYEKGPADGVYTYGLFLEGSRWNKEETRLDESLPKVLFSPAPIMHWVPYRKADVPTYPHYKCPVYKTSDRRGVLATTGHSSNFVCFIFMPSTDPESHWVERGVAMLTQLDD